MMRPLQVRVPWPVLIALLCGALLGAHVGRFVERAQRPAGEQQTIREVNDASAPTLPALRCLQSVHFDSTNTSRVRLEPRRPVDAEAAYHYARMALETARHYGGSPAYKQAWALEAIAGYLDVLVCGYVSEKGR